MHSHTKYNVVFKEPFLLQGKTRTQILAPTLGGWVRKHTHVKESQKEKQIGNKAIHQHQVELIQTTIKLYSGEYKLFLNYKDVRESDIK